MMTSAPRAVRKSIPPSADEERWQAVVRRDPAADGTFCFAVKTTGIYCRPSCTSRAALRKNVLFFDGPAGAEQAGFRACKRCQPAGQSLQELHAAAVAKACRLIDAADAPPKLGGMARAAGMSPFHFHRVFRAVTGLTPKAYAAGRRAGRMRDELARSGSVTEAIYESGYGSGSRFYEESAGVLGMLPRDFREGGRGTVIRFATRECPLGTILAASTEKGLCAILLGDDPDELVRNLRERFSKARISGADREYEEIVARVVEFVEQPKTGLDLPLDIRGTVFQQRVWQALRAIPAGQTATYAGIAAGLGKPSAVRAVAGACAANPLAVAIPCHRVVRSSGALSGYRWGVERKHGLIEREKATS